MKAQALRATLYKVPGLRRLAQEIRIRRRSLHDARDVDRAAIMRRLSANLELPDLPARRRKRGEIWAITMVKNEADIIECSIRHLLNQGVDHVLVADNLSTDATPEILKRLSQEHPVHVAHDRDPAHYQSWKMGLLAEAARRSGADWIVPFDADELWFGARGTLGAYLRELRADVVSAELYNLFPTTDNDQVGGSGWRLQTHAHRLGKVAFRAHRLAILGEGNHGVARPGVRAAGLKIVHVPWRSEQQFRRKVLQGSVALAATNLSTGVGVHWRSMAELGDEAAHLQWKAILRGEPVEGVCWAPAGPSIAASVWDWGEWDPQGLLVEAGEGKEMPTAQRS